jgi:hypothetical protein
MGWTCSSDEKYRNTCKISVQKPLGQLSFWKIKNDSGV